MMSKIVSRSLLLLTGIFLLSAQMFLAFPVFAAEPRLESIKVSQLDGDRIRLNVSLSAAVGAPKSFAIENPARICFDFPGVKNGLSRAASRAEYNVGVIKRVTVLEGAGKTRVVIDLNKSVPFEAQTQGQQTLITLAGSIPTKQTGSTPFSGQFSSKEASSGFNLRDIDFRRGTDGDGRVVIDLSDARIPIDLKEEGQQIRIRFAQTQLPARLQHKLDVTDFGTPVTMINTIRQGQDVEMTIHVNGYYENIAYQADRRFTIEVRPMSQEAKEQLQKKTFKYTGERLSLNFQDIEVRAVLQLIADFTGLNIVTSDTVTGNVTLRLRNVPWDQALDIILKTKGLSKRQNGNVLLIGPTEEMAAREKLELQSTQQVQDLSPLRAEYLQVNYAKAADIAALLKTDKNSMLSPRGTVSVDERTNTLLVQDTAAKIEEVRSLIARLDIPIRQVLIESRIVLASDDFQDILGIQMGVASKMRPGKEPVLGVAGSVLGPGGTGSSTVALGAPPASVNVGDRQSLNMLQTLPLSGSNTSLAQIGLTLARLPGGTVLDLELQALESEGLSKIVASPRLVTSNQQMAYIEQGTEIPYQESTSSGAASIAFKKAVLRLEVTPQITPDDHIIMDLKVNDDSVGAVTNGVPAINTKEMHTKVLVNNGETLVLGGIYTQTKNSQIDRIPFFGRLPLVGWMFKNQNISDQRSELMIFVTPKIIQEEMA